MIAADIGEHVADDAERRDHRRYGPRHSAGLASSSEGQRDNATEHQASLPNVGAMRRSTLVATSETPNSRPPASTIAGPEGRLP